jgi:leukotriene-A4 hydrolase
MKSGPPTSLVWALGGGADPDDFFSSVPYEKGFNLLNYLETLVGTELFEAFAAAYIDSNNSEVTTNSARYY